MREWPNRTVSKTVVPSGYRGFESHSLRSHAVPKAHGVAAALRLTPDERIPDDADPDAGRRR